MLRLAFSAVVSRVNRTVLALVAMALAAAILTSSMSMSRGIAKMAYDEYRAYYQGDIMIFTPTYVGASPIITPESPISRVVLYDSGFNSLSQLYPRFRTEGYLQYDIYPYVPIPELALEEMSNHQAISSLSPVKLLPSSLGGNDVRLGVVASNFSDYIIEGRLPNPHPTNGAIEVVVNAYGTPSVEVGQKVTLSVPTLKISNSGVPYADPSDPARDYSAIITGIVRWPTRELVWYPPEGAHPIWEQGYVHNAEAYVSDTVWQQVWYEQSGTSKYPVLAAVIRAENLSYLYSLAAELRSTYPNLAIKTVPDIARHAEKYNLLDRFYVIPPEIWMNEAGKLTQDYMPVEVGIASSALLMINAGMLLASQMLAGVAERKKEIGILKALGARRREIMAMVLIEGALLALTGSLIGFTLVRALGIHQDLSNNLRWAVVLHTTLREMAIVVTFTSAVALFFSAIPAARMSRLTVMEVFRND